MNETPTRVRHTPLQSAAQPPEEYLLRRYRVLERRGRGGFGTVCTCWDTRLQRRVAIKRMPLAAETGTTAAEALAEARTACMLGHPNIVTVFDFESDGTFAYLVMEYVDGLNLAELLARVETVLRRCKKTDRQLRFLNIDIDTDSRTVLQDGHPVDLTTKE